MIAVALFSFFAGSIVYGVAHTGISGLVLDDAHESHSSFGHPHQHPHRNSAEGANGVGADQIHNGWSNP